MPVHTDPRAYNSESLAAELLRQGDSMSFRPGHDTGNAVEDPNRIERPPVGQENTLHGDGGPAGYRLRPVDNESRSVVLDDGTRVYNRPSEDLIDLTQNAEIPEVPRTQERNASPAMETLEQPNMSNSVCQTPDPIVQNLIQAQYARQNPLDFWTYNMTPDGPQMNMLIFVRLLSHKVQSL